MTKRIGKAAPTTSDGGRLCYHVWFSPRGRRHALDGDVYFAVNEIFARVAREKGFAILEAASHPDHQHLLLALPDAIKLSKAGQFLKGISAREVFLRLPDLKADLGHDHLWQRGFGHRWIPNDQLATVAEYIRTHTDIHEGHGLVTFGNNTFAARSTPQPRQQ